ncbi:MAG: M48 family metallopeptidase [Sphaerochaetaceae bacterium]|nr:M48 family metallopeptidase [Sphaerochaetaceae bacterium]
MHFDDHGSLIVSAPYSASQSLIDSFISSNKEWIEQNAQKIPEHSYATGDSFPFFGKTYPLYVFKGERGVFQRDDGLYVFVPRVETTSTVKRELYRFYCKSLYSYTQERLPLFCSQMKLPVPTLEICNAKSRWGCCYRTKGLVKLSAITATLPKDLIDMTIIHELCHLVYDGHGEDFKNLLKTYVPDVKEREKELKKIAKSGASRNLF